MEEVKREKPKKHSLLLRTKGIFKSSTFSFHKRTAESTQHQKPKFKLFTRSNMQPKKTKNQNTAQSHTALDNWEKGVELRILQRRLQNLEEVAIFVLGQPPEQLDKGFFETKILSDKEKLSAQRVKEFVEQLLQDPSTNIGWIPDSIERRLNSRILQLVINMLTKLLETAKINLTENYTLSFTFGPIAAEQEQSTREASSSPNCDKERKGPLFDTLIFEALSKLLSSSSISLVGHQVGFELKQNV